MTGNGNGRPAAATHLSTSLYRLALVLILLVAWALLLWRLNDVPPGLQHDETFNAVDAVDLLYGRFKIYFPANFGREPLFFYSIAAAFKLAGGHFVWSLRWAGVAWALLGLAATAGLARRHLRPAAALCATALVAGSFWYLFLGRVGLRAITLLPLAAMTFYWLSRGLARRSWRDLALAGIPAGLAFYTYLAARVLFVLPPLLILYELVRAGVRGVAGRDERAAVSRPVILGLVLCLVIMGAIALPLASYLLGHPASADLRVGELNAPLTAALRGKPGAVLQSIWQGIESVLWVNRDGLAYQYSLPGRPVLAPWWAACLLVGLAAALRRLGRREDFFLAAALLTAMIPDLLAPGGPIYLRAVMALPLIFIVAVRGLWLAGSFGAARLARMRWGPAGFRPRAVLAALAVAVLVAAHVIAGARAYFVDWARADSTWQIYNGNLRLAAQLVDTRPAGEQVYISSDFWLDLDQQTYQFYEPRRRDAGWFSAARGLPIPSSGHAFYVVTLPVESMSPFAGRLMDAGDEHRTVTAGEGAAPALVAFSLSREAVDRELAGAAAPDGTLRYGDSLQLAEAGAELAGDAVDLLARWSVLGPWTQQSPPKLAAALVDGEGYVWAQAVDAPALAPNQWQPGAEFVQVSEVALPPDLPPGDYSLRTALSTDAGGVLPITRNGTYLATAPVVAHIRLSPAARSFDMPGAIPAAARPAVRPQAAIGGEELKLLGTWETLVSLLAGVPATLHASWQAQSALDTSQLHFRVTALAEDGSLLWQQDANPPAQLPATWPAGQIYRLAHRLQPELARTGSFSARLQLCALRGDQTLTCAVVARPEVTRRSLLLALPRVPEHKAAAEWGGQLSLAGYDIARSGGASGDRIALTLYWRAIVPPATNLKRFVHAVDAQDQIVAQADNVPENGGTPMPFWQPGEYVVDSVQLQIPAGQPVSRLWLGLYDPATGQRLPVRREGQAQPGDRFPIPLP